MKKVCRIAFVDSRYLEMLRDPLAKTGGATKQVAAWVDGLRSLGADVKIVGAHRESDRFDDNKDVIIAYNPANGVPKLRYLYVRAPGILRALRRSGSDYVYFGIPVAFACFLAICTKALGKKFILRVSNDFFVDDRAKAKMGPFRNWISRMGFSLADYIFCQNEYQFNKLKVNYPNKVFKITNPFLGNLVNEAVPFEERGYVAWVGIFQYQKNLPLLLEIVKAMPDVPFRIAGGNDRNLPQRDQSALDELSGQPNVKMMGFLNRDDVLRLLDGAWFLLNTSHYEGFSNTFLEAFSRGTPVYTLSQNDPDGIIQAHGLGGIFSSERDAQTIINKAVKEEETFRKQSTCCITYMKEHHELTRQCAEFLRLIGARRST